MKLDKVKEKYPEIYSALVAGTGSWNSKDEDINMKFDFKMTSVNQALAKLIAEETILSKSTALGYCKKTPLGNFWMVFSGANTIGDLVRIWDDGLTPSGQYAFITTNIEDFLKGIRSVQEVLHAEWRAEQADEAVVKDMPEDSKELKKSLAAALKDLEDALNDVETSKKNIKVLEDSNTALKSQLMASTTAASVAVKVEHDGTVPYGEVVMKKAVDVFGMIASHINFDIPCFEWDGVHPDVPQKDEHYIFRPTELQRVLYAIATNQRGYLHGHTGSGKTTLIEQCAAHMGWPFTRVNFDSEITRMDLIGRDKLKDGESWFEDGILPKALGQPGLICFDEIDFTRPDVSYVMQSVNEGNGIRVTEDGGRWIEPHPMCRIFATGNTVGQGDEHGMYQGARHQSMAFLDRFTVWCEIKYLSEEERKDLIKRHYPGLDATQAKRISQYVTEHMESFVTGKVLQPMTPRGMLSIAEATMFLDLKEALDMTVFERASVDDRAVLRGLIDRVVS